MRENNYKPQIPDVMEAIFDAATMYEVSYEVDETSEGAV
jgi:hypothetical protein